MEFFMFNTSVVSFILIFYSALACVGIFGWLRFLKKEKGSDLFQTTLILGCLLSIPAIPWNFSALLISGSSRYILATLSGIVIGFAPACLLSLVIFKIKEYKKEKALFKRVDKLLKR